MEGKRWKGRKKERDREEQKSERWRERNREETERRNVRGKTKGKRQKRRDRDKKKRQRARRRNIEGEETKSCPFVCLWGNHLENVSQLLITLWPICYRVAAGSGDLLANLV